MKVAILGGGASAFALAGLLGERDLDLDISIFDQGPSPMRKLKASGNGRCNFTNRKMGPECYTGRSRSFVGEVLKDFSFEEALAFFERLGMPARTMESGMTYPRTLLSESPVALLYSWALRGGVHLYTGTRAIEVKKKEGGGFEIRLEKEGGRTFFFSADLLVLATGGAYGIGKKEWSNGYSLVKDLGHLLSPIHPGIVGLQVKEKDLCRALSGLKMEAEISLEMEGEEESTLGDLLFTDYGLSGIGIFRLSNQVLDGLEESKGPLLKVSLFPGIKEEELVRLIYQGGGRPGWTLGESLGGLLPQKALVPLLQAQGLSLDIPFLALSSEKIRALISRLRSLPFHPLGSQKKDHGQITCGGLLTSQVDPKTMMSKKVPGLFFTGEVLDVQGICGGYNLHWAWASASRAGRGIQKFLLEGKK